MYELQSPNSQITVRPGNIVKLNRFDDECWVVNLGWFSYAGNRPMNGWYLVSTSHKDKVKPLNLSDLDDIYVVEIGEVKEDYKELDPKIKKLIHDLKVQVEDLQAQVAQLTVEVEAKDKVIEEKGQEILALQQQINDLAAEISALESQHNLDVETIETLNSQVRAQAEIIAEKAAEIRTLTARVEELAAENELLTQQHQEDLATIQQQASTIQEQAQSIADLTAENEELTDENDRLTDENAELTTQHEVDVETISTQSETITQQSEQITELSGEVSTLEGTVAEQQATITRQNTTIDELNRRVPPLQQLDPINPSDIQQTLNPESPNIGFPQVIVNAPTAEGVGFNENYYKEGETCLGKVGTYNPFPEQSYGGMYVTAKDDGFPTELTIDSWDGQGQGFNFNYDKSIFRGKMKSLVFRNCNNIPFLAFNLAKQIDQAPYFDGWGSLENLYIDGVQDLLYSPFCNAPLLKSVYISDKTSIIGSGAWVARGFLSNTPALETLRLPTGLTLLPYGFLSGSGIKEFSIPNTVTNIAGGVLDGYNYHGLQTLHIPNSVISIDNNVFRNQSDLENVTIENGFNCNNLKLNASTLYSVETIVSWLEALADRTGETAYTLTIGTTNINKLTAEQRAIATNKNWNLA